MEDNDKSVTMSDYTATFLRWRRLLVLVGGPIAVTALALAVGLPSVYESRAVIAVEEAKIAGYISTGSSGGQGYVDQYVASLSDRVLSDVSLSKLLKQHDLYPELSGDERAQVDRLRRDTDVEVVTSRILDPNSGREREVISAFRVAYGNRQPGRAQQGAAWLAQAYLDANRENRRTREVGATNFLSEEAERYKASIAEAERTLAEFKQKNYGKLPELTNVNMSMLDNAQRDLETTQLQIQTLQRDRVFMLQQLSQAQLTSPDSERVPILEAEYREKQQTYDENHPDLVSLRRQIDSLKASGTGGMSLQAQLQSQQSALAQARTRYSDDHPDVKRIVRRIEALQARIASGESATADPQTRSPVAVQLQTQVNAVDTQLASMQARAAELRGRLSMFETRISSTPEVEREYQNLNRGLELARNKYDELLKRQMDSEVNTAAISRGAADEFRLVQPASLPDRPTKPLRIAIAVIGLVLAGFLAVVAMLIADALDTTVRGARDLRRILGESPLAIVPDIMDDDGIAARKRQVATYGGGLIALGVALTAIVRVVFA